MATFWRRIREIFYGAAGEEDQEVGAIAEVQPAATRVTDEGSVRLDGGVRVQQAGEELLIAYGDRSRKRDVRFSCTTDTVPVPGVRCAKDAW